LLPGDNNTQGTGPMCCFTQWNTTSRTSRYFIYKIRTNFFVFSN